MRKINTAILVICFASAIFAYENVFDKIDKEYKNNRTSPMKPCMRIALLLGWVSLLMAMWYIPLEAKNAPDIPFSVILEGGKAGFWDRPFEYIIDTTNVLDSFLLKVGQNKDSLKKSPDFSTETVVAIVYGTPSADTTDRFYNINKSVVSLSLKNDTLYVTLAVSKTWWPIGTYPGAGYRYILLLTAKGPKQVVCIEQTLTVKKNNSAIMAGGHKGKGFPQRRYNLQGRRVQKYSISVKGKRGGHLKGFMVSSDSKLAIE